MQPLTIALLAAAFAAGALLGWLLRGERRERADAVRLSRLQSQLESQQSAIDRQQRQRDALQQKHDDARHRQREAERRVATMREAVDEQVALRRKLEQRMREMQARMATEREERKRLSRQLRLLIQRTQAARAAGGAQGVGTAPGTVADTAPAVSAASEQPDDLRRVRGIGPAMKRELAAWGVRTLAELAALDEARIDALDREIRFPGRIRRERWVEQARELIGENA